MKRFLNYEILGIFVKTKGFLTKVFKLIFWQESIKVLTEQSLHIGIYKEFV